MIKELTPEQIENINKVKALCDGHYSPNPDFCLLCPPECQMDDTDEHWYCRLIDGQICSTCCHFDMDAPNWEIREKWEDICDGCGHKPKTLIPFEGDI